MFVHCLDASRLARHYTLDARVGGSSVLGFSTVQGSDRGSGGKIPKKRLDTGPSDFKRPGYATH